VTETTASVPVPAQRSGAAVKAVAAFHDLWREMALCFPGGSYDVDRGIARARTGLAAPSFNGVWAVNESVTADAVRDAVAEFAAGDLPWNVQLRRGYSSELDAAFADMGLVTTGDVPFMVLSDPSRLLAAVDAVPLGLRSAESFVDLDRVLSLLEQGFDMPPELTREKFPVRFFALPDSTTWIGSVDGYDVTTAFGAVRRDLCGVFNVATPAASRGHGYGGAVTAATVLRALDGGARGAYLQSSPMDFSVYERLGFVTVERWRQWMPECYVGTD
jgi:hypothetical protein